MTKFTAECICEMHLLHNGKLDWIGLD